MKNFDWTAFNQKIAIRSNMTDLYNAWTMASELERWFLKIARFKDQKYMQVTKNTPVKKKFTYEWEWHLFDEVETGHILETNSLDHIQFTFAGKCVVDVHLIEQGDYVIVDLTQSNIPTDERSKQYVRLACASGWAFYLVNLKSVYEGGLDLRNKDTALSPMLNN